MAERPRRSLERYKAKRDFDVTPEPAGAAEGASEPLGAVRFVVQRHRARRLHYDFRLEIDGVLVSWAMPKGPSLDPSIRSLAVHVEDHPLEYRDFEGVIPKGEYGGGDVIVWDRGTWTAAKGTNPTQAVAEGELHFDLFGEKLRGRFVLIRSRGNDRGQDQWLMLHKQDAHSKEAWNAEHYPLSVKSGRTNDEVAASPDAMWRDRQPVHGARFAAPGADELAALDHMGTKGTWVLGDCEIPLTNLDKVLFPGRDGEPAVTKRELVRHYATVAPVMGPYLDDRPMNMHRFPNGSDRPGFWHKEVPDHAPDWLRRWRYGDAGPGETQHYAVVDSTAALVWMANFGAVELHPWTSTVADVREPTWAYIDIDPGARTTFAEVLVMARLYRAGLGHLGVEALPKVTGRRGIHIWIPIAPHYSFDETRIWVEKLSRAVGDTVPELVSWSWNKPSRGGLARLDYTQNAINKTLVAPYSVRAAPGAPVSVPIGWEELDDDGLRPDIFDLRSIPERLARSGDPFRRLRGLDQQLPRI
ncbi:MAG: DNA polymerase domain-containing protein [Acidimicrobiales bacterium]